AQFGPMSREMKASELDQFEARFGYPPTPMRVALDALAVYVHRDNPVQGLTLAQVDAIFSKSRACGYPEDITTWGQAGLTGPWANRPISLYGRNSASGTYGFFKENALCGGDYKDEVKEQPGSASVVQGVTVDLYGIGYSGIGYRTSGVRAVPLAFGEGEPFAEPRLENVSWPSWSRDADAPVDADDRPAPAQGRAGPLDRDGRRAGHLAGQWGTGGIGIGRVLPAPKG